MRVYCNFNNEFHQAYAYVNNDNVDMSGYNKIRKWCGSIGLEPIAI